MMTRDDLAELITATLKADKTSDTNFASAAPSVYIGLNGVFDLEDLAETILNAVEAAQ